MNVLLLTQNIGSIDCNDSATADGGGQEEEKNKEGVVPSGVKDRTIRWIRSVASFLERQEKICRNDCGSSDQKKVGENPFGRRAIDVVVLHLQEIGGKKFNGTFNDYLQTVIHRCYPAAVWCSGLMGCLESDDRNSFTAMGTVLFLGTERAASIWSFEKNKFLSDEPEKGTIREECYHGAKFSAAGKSRKGYLLTSIKVGPTILNFMNLHLFHDADNTVSASQPFPSEYTRKRAAAAAEAIEKTAKIIDGILVHDDNVNDTTGTTSDTADPPPAPPLFLFGDFNLRLDACRLKGFLQRQKPRKRKRPDEEASTVIRLERKRVHAPPEVWRFLRTARNWPSLKDEFDSDAAYIRGVVEEKTGSVLEELPVRFGPTYLLDDDPSTARAASNEEPNRSCGTEDDEEERNSNEMHGDAAALGASYQTTRFPAWCDRVWYNKSGKDLLMGGEHNNDGSSSSSSNDTAKVAYWTAPLYPMDHSAVHSAVYLRFRINPSESRMGT